MDSIIERSFAAVGLCHAQDLPICSTQIYLERAETRAEFVAQARRLGAGRVFLNSPGLLIAELRVADDDLYGPHATVVLPAGAWFADLDDDEQARATVKVAAEVVPFPLDAEVPA